MSHRQIQNIADINPARDHHIAGLNVVMLGVPDIRSCHGEIGSAVVETQRLHLQHETIGSQLPGQHHWCAPFTIMESLA